MSEQSFVGVDVSKLTLDVSILVDNNSFKYKQFNNSKSGYTAMLAWLKRYSDNLWICMEATGHYSELVAEYFYQKNILVSIVNPLQIKQFARLTLARNKNDVIDSRLIAQYAERFKPRTFTPRSKDQKSIRELAQLMDTLKQQQTQFSNQLGSLQSTAAKKALKSLIKSLEKKIVCIQEKILAYIKLSSWLTQTVDLLMSIKGVGQLTAINIIAYLPDISQFDNAKQLAAFIGVSPRQYQSGTFTGKTRLSKFGASRLRKALYMPALSAKNKNEHLQPFVSRLENNGLAPKAIIGAVMRKLVHIIFGMLKNRQFFDPNLV
jgi:transposase